MARSITKCQLAMRKVRLHIRSRAVTLAGLRTKLHCSPPFSNEDASDAMYCSYIPPNVVLQNWMVRVAVRRVKVKSMNKAASVCPPSFSMSSRPMNTFCQTKLGARKPFKRHQSITHCNGHDLQLNQYYVLNNDARTHNATKCTCVYLYVLIE